MTWYVSNRSREFSTWRGVPSNTPRHTMCIECHMSTHAGSGAFGPEFCFPLHWCEKQLFSQEVNSATAGGAGNKMLRCFCCWCNHVETNGGDHFQCTGWLRLVFSVLYALLLHHFGQYGHSRWLWIKYLKDFKYRDVHCKRSIAMHLIDC